MADKKILLVDDVMFFLELEKSFLKRTSCDVITASNGTEGLEAARREKPDLILMDLFMPEMNGDECCKAIKTDPDLKDIPIIMVTTAGKDEEKGRCQLAGCDGYITKPINKMELLETVKKYLDIPIRLHVRVPVEAQVDYTFENKEYISTIGNISEGGMFIESESPQALGSMLKMRFKVPGSEKIMEVEGKVVRLIDSSTAHPVKVFSGMGIQFTNISVFDRKAIADYVKSGNYMV